MTLYKAQQAIRPEKERHTRNLLQDIHGKNYDGYRLYDSKNDVSDMLDEEKAERSVREQLHKLPQEQRQEERAERPHKPKSKDWER